MHDKTKIYTSYEDEDTSTFIKDANPRYSPLGPREYVYNLLPKAPAQKKPIPTKFYKASVPAVHEELKRKKEELKANPHRTMGPPGDCGLPPLSGKHSEFVRKHAKQPMILQGDVKKKIEAEKSKPVNEDRSKRRRHCTVEPRPTVKYAADLAKDPLIINSRTRSIEVRNQINFVQRNAIQHAIAAQPGHRVPKDAIAELDFSKKEPSPVGPGTECHGAGPKFVDTRQGNTQSLSSTKTHSGLTLRHVRKPSYGRVPAYLKHKTKRAAEARRQAQLYANEKAALASDYLLTNDQRQEILNGLRAAWDRNNRIYLSLSSSSNTLKCQAYKAHLEHEMDCLEKDIEAIQGHEYIFVESKNSADKIKECYVKVN